MLTNVHSSAPLRPEQRKHRERFLGTCYTNDKKNISSHGLPFKSTFSVSIQLPEHSTKLRREQLTNDSFLLCEAIANHLKPRLSILMEMTDSEILKRLLFATAKAKSFSTRLRLVFRFTQVFILPSSFFAAHNSALLLNTFQFSVSLRKRAIE